MLVCLLWKVHLLSEVIPALHHVGQTPMRDVEQIDEGLHIARLQQTTAYTLTCVVFVLVGMMIVVIGVCLLFLVFVCELEVGLFVPELFVEQDGVPLQFGGLLEGLDLAFFLSVLFIAMSTSVLSYAFMIIIQKTAHQTTQVTIYMHILTQIHIICTEIIH